VSNPHVEDAAYWASALEHYHWDRLEEAYEAIRRHGIGEAGSFVRWYRSIEAEYLTRAQSRIERINDWLSFEYVPDQIEGLRDALVEQILRATDEVAERLGWEHSSPTLVAVLAQETDGPWATNPYGYCIGKEEYEKICLPDYLVDDPDEFAQAVAHEYAHVISESLADGHAPRWLEEAISVLAEHGFDEEVREMFVEDPELWLDPRRLETMLDSRADTDEEEDDVYTAYQQAGWIGRYLAALEGERRLGALLRECANESVLHNLKLSLTGRERADGAVQNVYGITTSELFRRAYDYMAQVDPPDSD
jgi:hypothetical protein